MADNNKAVAYVGGGKVEIQTIDYPTFELQDGPGVDPENVGRKIRHGVILKMLATNICGSDQHMVRGRTTAPEGLVLGHEITGEVVEPARTSSSSRSGTSCRYPSTSPAAGAATARNAGRVSASTSTRTGPARHTAMSTWVAGSAARRSTSIVPYADLNLLKFPDQDGAMEKILDLTMLSDIFPTGFHGCVTQARASGRRCTSPGRGPSGWRPRPVLSCRRRGHHRRRPQRRPARAGPQLRLRDRRYHQGRPEEQIEQILGVPEVDGGVDAVGFEARAHGTDAETSAPATVLNSLMGVVRAGGGIGIPGLYVTDDPGGVDEAAEQERCRYGSAWAGRRATSSGPASAR